MCVCALLLISHLVWYKKFKYLPKLSLLRFMPLLLLINFKYSFLNIVTKMIYANQAYDYGFSL